MPPYFNVVALFIERAGDLMSKLIRIASIITAMLSFFFAIHYINYNQFNNPLDTNASFHISLSDSNYSKTEIISDLNKISNNNKTYFLLPSSWIGYTK